MESSQTTIEIREREIQEARDYLSSLINKYLRVTSKDGRIFWGQFKCIDPVRLTHNPDHFISFYLLLFFYPLFLLATSLPRCAMRATNSSSQDRNIILSQTFEYRQPSAKKRLEAAQNAGDAEKVTLQMSSRFLGLVVVPGMHIAKIELEEFASQLKKPSARAAEALQKQKEIQQQQR